MNAQPGQPPTVSRRRYSDAQQAEALAALAANGGDTAATAAQFGMPEPTLRQWASGLRRPCSMQLHEEKKAELAARLDRLALKMLRQANRRARDMNGRDAVIGAAVCIDKALLLRGEATAIVSTADAERLALFRQRYAKLHALPVTATDTPQPPAQLAPPAPPSPSGPDATPSPADRKPEGG